MIVEEEFEKEMFKSVPAKNIPTKTTTPPKSKSQKSGKGPNQEMIEQDQSLNQTIDTMPEIQSSSTSVSNEIASSSSEAKAQSYNVVAGSFLVPSNADKLIDKLVKLGYKFTTKKILADSGYSVVVNHLTRRRVKNLVSQLKAKKIDCFIKINP
jgi:cell division septation protein DedD